MKYSLFYNGAFVQSAEKQGHLAIASPTRIWRWIVPMVKEPTPTGELSIEENNTVVLRATFSFDSKKIHWKQPETQK